MSTPGFSASRFLLINTTLKSLHLYIRNQLEKSFPVAVGAVATPTPTGRYKVVTKIYHPGGMLGTRWLGLSVSEGNYGIHGTNDPSSIGREVTNGCIRLHNEHIEELFSLVNIGTPVHITTVTDNYQLPNQGYAQPSPEEELLTQPELPLKEDQGEEYGEEAYGEEALDDYAGPDDFAGDFTNEDQYPDEEVTRYIVQPGDTLWSIARRFGLPVQRVMEYNRLMHPNIIYPGQEIYIPPRNSFRP
ncbi:L,D-transpeptidase family protein [Desulfofalx alkaliphila]|uniref:L,D-transpeptidase family protein n=1 Tax=Desulfofalx alkaliphila TaxID=105483 RepID=UPI0004E20F67|nr:L,D-transpeptidase family protein [Desulfofalx alkaliphila]